VYATVNTYRLLASSTMVMGVGVPVTVALVWSLSNCTVTMCLTFVTTPLTSYSNARVLLTRDGFARRFTL